MAFHSNLKSLLLEAGLNETEVLVYLELLKNPAENIWDLVARTKLPKTSVYRTCDSLHNMKLIEKTPVLKALSLKHLVANLSNQSRKLNKVAWKIKSIAPFLRTPNDPIDSIDYFYTKDQIAGAYLFMSELDYNVNLDFGDFEGFVPFAGGIRNSFKFRNNRIKHAGHKAICTTFGPNSAHFCTKEAQAKYKNNVEFLNLDFTGKFIIFSDMSDYVLFNDFSQSENPMSVLVKSKPVAEIQRKQFDIFSQCLGNS